MQSRIPKSAGGWSAIRYSLKMAQRAGGLWPIVRALYTKNTCKTCALGMGGQKGGLFNEAGSFPEICNKSFQAQASDMQGVLPEDFFDRHDIEYLSRCTPQELELSGRLTRPILCESKDRRYRTISWEEALNRVAEKILATPRNRSYFYASGRSSNEAGFLLQLFARVYGTNNINNCSYFCHQASGVGLSQTLGASTATIQLKDLDHADLLFLVGANPASNHPRFMKVLMKIRRRGGKVIVINPAREKGLENFSVPSDLRSLLFGSEISSQYIQPNVGGDIALLQGIAKALFKIAESNPEVLPADFIATATENFVSFKASILEIPWEILEKESGVSRNEMESVALSYSRSRNAVFAWAMGITHHIHGVNNVKMIVNLSLMRGMVGRPHAGLLPLRGHSNVQGIGSVGFTPQLKHEIMEKLEAHYGINLPREKGMDTLGCIKAAYRGEIDFAWHLGGNLFLSNPDSAFAERALSKIGLALYMNTTLNPGHFRGRGQSTLVLPVLARDEEPQPSTQESMFNFIRMSNGGLTRYHGPRSEISVIAEIAARVLSNKPVPWDTLRATSGIRKVIGSVVPGFDDMKSLDLTRKEFYVTGRILHQSKFPTPSGKAKFTSCPRPQYLSEKTRTNHSFMLTTVRSEGQFNTVVFDAFDRYRGAISRNVVLIHPDDLRERTWKEGETVTVKNETGVMKGQVLLAFDIRRGNVMMYYPEANILVPALIDERSRTPAFKSVCVEIFRE